MYTWQVVVCLPILAERGRHVLNFHKMFYCVFNFHTKQVRNKSINTYETWKMETMRYAYAYASTIRILKIKYLYFYFHFEKTCFPKEQIDIHSNQSFSLILMARLWRA